MSTGQISPAHPCFNDAQLLHLRISRNVFDYALLGRVFSTPFEYKLPTSALLGSVSSKKHVISWGSLPARWQCRGVSFRLNRSRDDSPYSISNGSHLLFKARRQYLLTSKVSRYCLLASHGRYWRQKTAQRWQAHILALGEGADASAEGSRVHFLLARPRLPHPWQPRVMIKNI